jgi:16S rRNA (adenine1518-N6/adenine1519-N6)-dimethyltransferase
VKGHTARKRFGQNFLVDVGVIEAIVGAIAPLPGEALVEIGPGLGALTHPLLARCPGLTVIELDRDLADRLRGNAQLQVIQSDVLQVDFARLAAQRAQLLRVVGNLPYNVSTPILFHLLPFAAHIRDQHFMLQREVVQRMVAKPGNKDYGRLSVMLQWRYQMHSVLDVPPEAFEPAPQVHSAIVRMRPLPDAPVALASTLSALVTTAFSQRRKVLRNTLEPWLRERGFSGEFDFRQRAEEVSVATYLALAAAVHERPAAAQA